MLLLRCKQNGPLWSYFKKNNNDRISATELAPALGVGRYRSANSLFLEKKGSRLARDFENDAMRRGREEEANGIAHFAQNWGSPEFKWIKPGVVMDPQEPLCCSPDAMFGNQYLFGLEIKVPNSENIPREPEQISIDHLLQCFQNLHVTRAKKWFLYYYRPDKPRKSRGFVIYPNNELWSRSILPSAREFFTKVGDTSLSRLPRSTNKKGNSLGFRKEIRAEILRGPVLPDRIKETFD